MFNIRKESWSDVKRTAERAVYSDMRVALYLDYRKLECLKAGLLALDTEEFSASDVMKNARTVLLQDINSALAEIDGEAARFKNLLDTAFKSKTLNPPADWVASDKKMRLGEDVGDSPVYDIDTQT